MNLKSVGHYYETGHGFMNGYIHDVIDQADPALIPEICNYLDQGIPLIVSPGISNDIFDHEKVIPFGNNEYTDGTWVWPGDLSYYVKTYRLRIPDEFLQAMINNEWHNPASEDCVYDEGLSIDGAPLYSDNAQTLCPECGAEMHCIDPVRHVGMICPNCGWGWATTDFDPILDDLQDYSIILEEAVKPSAEMVKTLSRITGQNYIKARELLKNPPCVIYTGKAKAVKLVASELSSLSIGFSIQPPFSHLESSTKSTV